jgi:hypothetical protein
MSGDHAKKEMDTGDKPTTSHGSTSSEESRNKRMEKKTPPTKGKGRRRNPLPTSRIGEVTNTKG